MTNEDLGRLRARWLDLVGAFGVSGAAAEGAFADLAARYADEARSYHTMHHVADVLDTIDRLRDQARALPAARFAPGSHAAVYDTHARHNEERSADLGVAVLRGLQAPAGTPAAARDLIMLTRTHRADPADRDGLVLLDADLAVLGTPPDQ